MEVYKIYLSLILMKCLQRDLFFCFDKRRNITIKEDEIITKSRIKVILKETKSQQYIIENKISIPLDESVDHWISMLLCSHLRYLVNSSYFLHRIIFTFCLA